MERFSLLPYTLTVWMIMKNVHVGTCGFNGTQTEYVQKLSCVEVQHTFYQPPQLRTLERWRQEVPAPFEFTLKAWQLITHEAKSPTYKRLKRKLTDQEKQEAGAFRPTAIVEEAWQTTRACAEALGARMVLFQCPASFRQTPENVHQLQRFFSELDRGTLHLAWEPRGDWEWDVVEGLCEDLHLWHAVDPFVQQTTTPETAYFRLHGRDGWRYQYEAQELRELKELLPEEGQAYVFFNNRHMIEDAQTFQQILNEES